MLSAISRCRALASHAGLPFITLTGILCACSGSRGGAPQVGVALRDSLSCGAGPAADRTDPWLPSDSHYARTAVQGNSPDTWFAQISGAALVGGHLYVFDAQAARILVFDDRLTSLVGSFGSKGEGPGEFRGAAASNEYGPPRWLMPGAQGELIVFDGYRIQRFGADGRYLGLAMSSPAAAGLTLNTPRFGWAHDSLYFSAGGYDYLSLTSMGLASGNSSPVFYGRVAARGHRRDLLAMPLPRLPRGTVGSRQAMPVWAFGPKCLWASDGSRPVFYRVRRDGTGRDSMVLDLQLPDPPLEWDTDVDSLLRQTHNNVPLAKATALWRIRDLLFDPADYLWIRLNPKRSSDLGVGVAAVDPESGKTVVFQVPAFPLAFGAPGVFYAATRDSMNRPLIGRFAASRGAEADSTSSHPWPEE